MDKIDRIDTINLFGELSESFPRSSTKESSPVPQILSYIKNDLHLGYISILLNSPEHSSTYDTVFPRPIRPHSLADHHTSRPGGHSHRLSTGTGPDDTGQGT